jgi:hypothetical protein
MDMAIIKEFTIKGNNNASRKLNAIKDIALASAKIVLEDSKVYTIAGAVGLYQGLKYNGNVGRGMKAGVATIGVMIGANIVQNLVSNIDEIKNV